MSDSPTQRAQEIAQAIGVMADAALVFLREARADWLLEAEKMMRDYERHGTCDTGTDYDLVTVVLRSLHLAVYGTTKPSLGPRGKPTVTDMICRFAAGQLNAAYALTIMNHSLTAHELLDEAIRLTEELRTL